MPSFARPIALTRAVPGWTPGTRVTAEYYPTPPEAVRALLSVETFDGSIWEPACGDGRLANVLKDHGYTVECSDLHHYGYGAGGVDFFRQQVARARHIVTNPPYGRGLADRFVEHALELARITGGKVVMLLNLASLCSPARTAWWQATPPSRLYFLDECECWDTSRFGPAPWRKNTQRYVWAVWDHVSPDPTIVRWLSTSTFR